MSTASDDNNDHHHHHNNDHEKDDNDKNYLFCTLIIYLKSVKTNYDKPEVCTKLNKELLIKVSQTFKILLDTIIKS